MIVSRIAVTMLLCCAVLAPAFAQELATAKVIDVANYSFAPKAIQLAAGRPVTLSFVNRSGSGHDFTAREFFAASSITAGAAPGGRVALSAHETKTITLVPRAGTYEAHCSHFLHASMGMTAQIIVG